MTELFLKMLDTIAGSEAEFVYPKLDWIEVCLSLAKLSSCRDGRGLMPLFSSERFPDMYILPLATLERTGYSFIRTFGR